MAGRIRKNRPLATVSSRVVDAVTTYDDILAAPPIPQPKPWTDALERAAIAGGLGSCSPHVALTSIGVPPTTANTWLSDEPPEAYARACLALRERLKAAQDASERMLLGRIQAASQDPRYWTAAAWILERSRGYVVKQNGENGPNIVVNIGSITMNQAKDTPIRQIVEGEVVAALPERTEPRT